MSHDVVIVVGNPKEHSRTRQAAERLARALIDTEPAVIELAPLAADLATWGPECGAVKERVAEADLVIVASPTFKATYTGLLKLFLDLFPGGSGLAGTVVVPVMLSAAPQHALAAQHTLVPVLTEIGALPFPALALSDSSFTEDGAIEQYADRWRPSIVKLLAD